MNELSNTWMRWCQTRGWLIPDVRMSGVTNPNASCHTTHTSIDADRLEHALPDFVVLMHTWGYEYARHQLKGIHDKLRGMDHEPKGMRHICYQTWWFSCIPENENIDESRTQRNGSHANMFALFTRTWDIEILNVMPLPPAKSDLTPSYVRHESFTCMTWLIHTCDTTHSNVWSHQYMCIWGGYD